MTEAAETEIAATDVRRAAMDLLARREHGFQELCDKLLRRFGPSPLIRDEVGRLRDEGLQNDTRFAEAYLHSRVQRLYGPARIRLELRERRIAEDVIEETLSASAVDWSVLVRELMWRKFGRKPPENVAERAKRQRFLAYRGFNNVRLLDDEPDALAR
jgi:regulatory protein